LAACWHGAKIAGKGVGYEMNTSIQKSPASRKVLKDAFLAAFPLTVPIFAGFWFLGLTYGIYMNVSGFSFWYPMLMSITIFAGSMEVGLCSL